MATGNFSVNFFFDISINSNIRVWPFPKIPSVTFKKIPDFKNTKPTLIISIKLGCYTHSFFFMFFISE